MCKFSLALFDAASMLNEIFRASFRSLLFVYDFSPYSMESIECRVDEYLNAFQARALGIVFTLIN